jgi:hypothetical protein
MDLPLELLKDVTQAIPTMQGTHYLTWSPEVGYELHLNLNGQTRSFRFDYGETVTDLKEQIEQVTGIPLPDKKKEKKKKEEVVPGETAQVPKTAAMATPILDSIKAATFKPPAQIRQMKGERKNRSGMLPRLRKFYERNQGSGSGALGAIDARNQAMSDIQRDLYGG